MSKPCKYCGETITWSKEAGKWVPYSENGSRHDCQSGSDGAKSTPSSESLSPALEGAVRRIAREVAEQVFKEQFES